MSMLSAQADRLRDRADELRMLASGMDAPYIVPSTKETMALAMQSAASEMREAADTIISLRNRLQELQGVGCESMYTHLFGTPERAARTIARWCAESDGSCAGCPLFGSGYVRHCLNDYSDIPSLLEWLESEDE